MSIINNLNEASRKANSKNDEIILEIEQYFKDKINSESFEADLERHIRSYGDILNRKCKASIEFWEYHDGCTATHFQFLCYRWKNPENPEGWESRRYKGVELRDISNITCERLMQIARYKLEQLGFAVSFSDASNALGYFDKIVTIRW